MNSVELERKKTIDWLKTNKWNKKQPKFILKIINKKNSQYFCFINQRVALPENATQMSYEVAVKEANKIKFETELIEL